MQWGPRRDRVAITERVAAHQGWPLIKSGSTVITETRHYLYHTASLGSEVLQKLIVICNHHSVVITASVEHQLSSIYTHIVKMKTISMISQRACILWCMC